MEQARAAERGKGARKAVAAQPVLAPKGRGRKQGPPSSECPAKAKAWLWKEGDEPDPAGKESAPGRKTSLKKKSTPKAEKCEAAGKSNNPAEDRGALRKKQELLFKAKAVEEEKEKAAWGAVPRKKNHVVPKEERPDPEGEKAAPCRGRKASQKDLAPKAKEPDQRRAEGAVPGPGGRPPARRSPLWSVRQRLTLRRREISGASQQVNLLRDRLVKAITSRLSFVSGNTLGTGSYYEHLKINKPDEFDIMLKVPGLRLDLEPYNDCDHKDAHYFVKLKRNPRLQQLNNFLDDDQRLSASKILSALRPIIIDEIKTIKEMKVTMEKKKPGSPAVTLQIGEPPSHISVDIILALEMESTTLWDRQNGGPDVINWLGKQVQKELYQMRRCLVPKNVKVGDHFIDTWRLSFSHAEKAIIAYHGNGKTCCEGKGKKCCRKDCLKLLKHFLEELKTKHQNGNKFNKFCSYHAKTAFFHTCAQWTSDDEWLPENFDECFGRLLGYFLNCLRKVELKHFFIPECNLFCDDMKCSVLAKAIENERANEFPIFKQT